MDDLFTCHVVGWKKISPNYVGGKLFKGRYTLKVLNLLVAPLKGVKFACSSQSIPDKGNPLGFSLRAEIIFR